MKDGKFIELTGLFQKEMVEAGKVVEGSGLQYRIIEAVDEIRSKCDTLQKTVCHPSEISVQDSEIESQVIGVMMAIDRLHKILKKEIKERCQK